MAVGRDEATHGKRVGDRRVRRERGRAAIATVATLLGVAALAVVWYLLRPPLSPQGPESAPATTAPVRATVPAPAAPVEPGSQAREMIAEMRESGVEPDLDRVFTEALAMRAAGAGADAFLLLFFAARQGLPEAARELGRIYDPEHYAYAEGVVDGPSLEQAYKWYRLAADGGDGEALTALGPLRARVEQAAATGDEDATLLLSRWRS